MFIKNSQLLKKYNNDKGFTLVELMVVIAVIGILGALIIPQFSSLDDKARNANAQYLTNAVASAAAVVYNQTGNSSLTATDLKPYITNIDNFITNSNESGKYSLTFVNNKVLLTSIDTPVITASAVFR